MRKCIINQCSDQAVDRFYCRLSFCYFVAVFNLVATEPRVPGDHLFICSFHRQHLWWLITLFSHTRRRSVNKDHNRKLNQCTDHENQADDHVESECIQIGSGWVFCLKTHFPVRYNLICSKIIIKSVRNHSRITSYLELTI